MGTKTSNNNSARAAHFLAHFFAVTVRLPCEIPIFQFFQLGKIATKFEKTRSPLNSDVLAAVADVVAKASLWQTNDGYTYISSVQLSGLSIRFPSKR